MICRLSSTSSWSELRWSCIPFCCGSSITPLERAKLFKWWGSSARVSPFSPTHHLSHRWCVDESQVWIRGVFIASLRVLQADVVRTGSVESMSFPLCFANVVVSAEWFFYGTIMADLFIEVSLKIKFPIAQEITVYFSISDSEFSWDRAWICAVAHLLPILCVRQSQSERLESSRHIKVKALKVLLVKSVFSCLYNIHVYRSCLRYVCLPFLPFLMCCWIWCKLIVFSRSIFRGFLFLFVFAHYLPKYYWTYSLSRRRIFGLWCFSYIALDQYVLYMHVCFCFTWIPFAKIYED